MCLVFEVVVKGGAGTQWSLGKARFSWTRGSCHVVVDEL